jgi:hypothetical protein
MINEMKYELLKFFQNLISHCLTKLPFYRREVAELVYRRRLELRTLYTRTSA